MAEMIALGRAAGRLSDLVTGVRDEQLDRPTPCDDSTVADLLDHVSGVAQGFAAAASKDLGPMPAPPPAPDGSRLSPAWRKDIPNQVATLARAWAEPAAWEGM